MSLVFAKTRLIVASGPTREWIDPVRFLTNASSGKTGWEIARSGLNRFIEVIYIVGPCDTPYRRLEGALNIPVTTTEEMGQAVLEALAPESLLIMAAAPADFTPVHVESHKIKKQPGETLRHLELRPTMDILQAAGEHAPKRCFRVGFAAETQDLAENALAKLKRKRAHFICANEVYRDRAGFGEIPNTLRVFDALGGERRLGPLEKDALAPALLDYLENRLHDFQTDGI